jgi:succinyl-CoA synthetase alpha subunit
MTTADPAPAPVVQIRRGVYHDSVTLLRVSHAAAAVPGVDAAQVAMATALNLELAAGLGFSVPSDAGPNDLLITVRGADDAAVRAGLAAVEQGLVARVTPTGGATGVAPARTVRAGAHDHPAAGVVLLSVPGPAVLGEALDAIEAGRHVMIFSDNVPVADELTIKEAAAHAGVLAMGPDCGTAILGGVGLGFTNVLHAAGGPRVGIVAASGTGAQQLTCLLDEAGVAVSHVLGVGGRDLSAVVGGRSARAALAALDTDPGTDHIAVISKPADPQVAADLRAFADTLATRVTQLVIGPGEPDITAGAEQLIGAVGGRSPIWPTWGLADAADAGAAAGAGEAATAAGARAAGPVGPDAAARPGALRGLYSGGTLADEAMLVLADTLGDIRSNIPLRPELALPARINSAGAAQLSRNGTPGTEVDDFIRAGVRPHGGPDLTGLGHAIVDLGDDAFTVGRPHPMIDPTLRLALLTDQAADPDVAVVLLDVVLGHGADADPAATLAPAIANAVESAARIGRGLAVVVALCGTAADPQDRERQAAALAAAGAQVHLSNAAAARAAGALARTGVGSAPAEPTAAAPDRGNSAAPSPADVPQTPLPADGTPLDADLLTAPAEVICAGIGLLADALRDQSVRVVEVDYRPPSTGTAVDQALRTVLADPRRPAANAEAVRRMLGVRARLVDVRPAAEALGLRPGQFCHAGPPINYERASGPMRGALIGALIFEGLAADPAEAEALLSSGDGIELTPCHDRHAVGPMAGVISPSMWMFELADEHTGARAFCSLNEGLGKVLRYGAYGPAVIDRLRWMTDVLGPALAAAVRAAGPVDITAIVGQMVQMGDEGHNRNRAGTLMLLRELLPALIASGRPAADIAEVARFVATNDHFFLNLVMPTGKLMGDAAAHVPGSTIVTAMCRNGTDFGIRVSGTGDEWFTGPALFPDGLFLPGFGPDDANPDIGDSAITETMGVGGMAMATAPAIVRFVGGTVPDALAVTRRMYEITQAENPAFAIPILEFRGSPTGIDVTRVLRTGILPQINTGMAGRVAGTGQVGAGLVTPPMECFTTAIHGLAARAAG